MPKSVEKNWNFIFNIFLLASNHSYNNYFENLNFKLKKKMEFY